MGIFGGRGSERVEPVQVTGLLVKKGEDNEPLALSWS